jgi:hypothetical protein
VQQQLVDHIYHAVLDGSLPAAAGSIIRITHAETQQLELDTALAITGSAGVVDGGDDLIHNGERYLSRQAIALGGAPPKLHATSSRNAFWASPANSPPTVACPSIKSSATRAEHPMCR